MTFDEQIEKLVKGYDYPMEQTFMAGANAAREILQGEIDNLDRLHALASDQRDNNFDVIQKLSADLQIAEENLRVAVELLRVIGNETHESKIRVMADKGYNELKGGSDE